MRVSRSKLLLIFMVLCAIYIDYNYDNDEVDFNEIRRLHKENLEKSPFTTSS